MTARRRPTFIALVALPLLMYPAASAQDAGAAISVRLNKLVAERFAATRCPGLTVAVAARNKIVSSLSFGLADIEQRVPMTTMSVHRLASLSKPITGTIIMDLVTQGKLVLDSPIRRYLPELPESYEHVTLRHLVDLQSGVVGDENLRRFPQPIHPYFEPGDHSRFTHRQLADNV